MTGNILVVEDQEAARVSLCELLREEGYQVQEAPDGTAAIRRIDEHDLDLVLTDLRIPGPDGLAVLNHVREVSPQTLGILMTAYASVDTAVEALHLGAQDYIIKPLIFEDVLSKVHRLIDQRSLAWEIQMLRREAYKHSAPEQPVGRSKVMRDILTLVEKVAVTPSTVLITGESGVGKEVVARTIHLQSERKNNVFLPVNCSAIPETLLESQLFGYVKGAFTGAVANQEGLFQKARGGTIFLDEIGEMPLSLQPKLLRVIEEKKVMPVGSTNPIQVDVRILASTNRDLKVEVEEGRFRGDLFYRLNVIGIPIPPLRERREDIPPLVEYLLRRHNLEMKKNYKGVDNATMRLLLSLVWKGNVRELDNVLERAMILGNGEWITPADLPAGDVPESNFATEGTLEAMLRVCERIQIEKALEDVAGDKKRAAEHLGLSLSTLYRKIEKLEIAIK